MTHLWTCYTPDWEPLAELVLPNWREYADRHGYHLCAETYFRPSLPTLFAKAHAVSGYWWTRKIETLWVLDLDIIFTNMTQALPQPKAPITISYDINGRNAGVYALSGPKLVPYLYQETLVALAGHFANEPNPDQTAMCALAPAYDEFTDYVPQPCFNSIPLHEYPEYNSREFSEREGQWKPGHLLCHFPGRALEQRLELITKYLKEVVR